MPNFPTLSQNPDANRFAEEAAADPTIRSEFEDGKVLTRARFTNVPKKWTLVYRYLSSTDKASLRTFEESTVYYGTESFSWTNPNDSETYTVRFGKPIKYDLELSQQNEWKVEIELVEAI